MVCRLTVNTPPNDQSDEDALTMLRGMPRPSLKAANAEIKAASAVLKVFNTAELRLSIFSLLPAQGLLVAQRVCRSWYLHVALEHDLQQRLFFEAGPGELVSPANDGKPVVHITRAEY